MFSITCQFSQLAQQVVLIANDQCVGQTSFTVTEAKDVG